MRGAGFGGTRPSAALAAALVTGGLWLAPAPAVETQAPIRIGASVSRTGVAYGLVGQSQLRGYDLCVKHANDRGGMLGRRLELVIEDDQSQAALAVRNYEKLVGHDRVEAILGPTSSPITDAVADVAERHRMPMVAPIGGVTSTFKKGRRFVFMMYSPSERYLEGLVDLAAKRGLRTIALVHEDSLFPRAVTEGGVALARRRGLSVLLVEAYPRGTSDFSAILARVRAADPDVLAAGTHVADAVALTRQLKGLDVNPRMFMVTVGSDLPEFHQALGRAAEFVYGPAQWAADLAAVRAGGLIPIGRQYPGAREFAEAHRAAYPGIEISYFAAAGYGGCQVLLEAMRRAGSPSGEKIRDAIARLDFHTVFGAFRVDPEGIQVAHRLVMFQWQDGRKVIVWPEELAQGNPRFPTPPWSQRP